MATLWVVRIRGDLVWLVDFANPENNDFVVANQLTVIENGVNKRPDVVLFVNGLPLVVIELVVRIRGNIRGINILVALFFQ
jgi:type I site-specific restriction-modification system R (restriction) subunit